MKIFAYSLLCLYTSLWAMESKEKKLPELARILQEALNDAHGSLDSTASPETISIVGKFLGHQDKITFSRDEMMALRAMILALQ